jgi:Domain of unknown function (DUF4340)
MGRPLLVNASLLGLALLLGGLVWLSVGQQETDHRIPLTSLLPKQITLIEIQNSKGPAIHLERKDGSWMMIKPSEGRANNSKIDSLLKITQAVSISRFKAPTDLTEYGLNPPQAVMTINQTRIEMGTTSPINQRRYLRVGDQIHLINDRFPHQLQAKAKYFKAPKAN